MDNQKFPRMFLRYGIVLLLFVAAVHSNFDIQPLGPSIIYPGTKWCGPGNVAGNDTDFGELKEVDLCCFAHDYCDDTIEAGGTKHGLDNFSLFTKLNCGCDEKFRRCLEQVQVDSLASHTVGEMYFIGNQQCFKEEHPIIECEEYNSFIFMRRCTKYKLDESQPKTYQFFDLDFYDFEKSTAERSVCERKLFTPSNIAAMRANAK